MENFILDLLRASGADGWTVADEYRKGWEFYFIRHALDQNRVRDVEHIVLTVYKRFSEDGQEFLGSASAGISPTASRDEAEKLIAQLLGEAKLIRNPIYKLNEPRGEAAAAAEAPDLRAISGDFLRAMRSVEESEDADINSYEIFADCVTRRFISSTGIDVTDVYPASMTEVVVNARRAGHEIELYRMYRSGSCDAAALKANVEETLRFGRDKLRAGKTPALGKYDVVFSTDDALEIYGYFIDRMSTNMVYQHISDFEIGKRVCEDEGGDPITIRAKRFLENSSHNGAYDNEGAPVRDMTIIEGGVARNYFGSRMFSQYLGLQDSFMPGNFAVDGGASSAAELRTGRFLEIVEFSDFQVDSTTGDIAGEIRLGYLHDGDSVTIVEGGSVSGTMRELAGTMRFSKELKQYNNYRIPAVTRLHDAVITGAE
ncbi:MAG: TldD/PmbA family protein [Oscillospiraceae bacterium]|nr:TldD/PmbA family protein [Oscillospiraceae bacterium]